MCAQKLSFDYAHTLHTVRIVHNAHSVHRSRVQKGKSCDCINFVRATEPSCGTGNFFGLLPESMQNSKLHGVEIDTLTGRIAKQLYQKANIAIEGFEKTNLPDDHFDVVLGNVPFGEIRVNDNRYNAQKFLIHDYFFAKALDKVRAGGVVMFITSKGTMDKASPEVRKYIAQTTPLRQTQARKSRAILLSCKSVTE